MSNFPAITDAGKEEMRQRQNEQVEEERIKRIRAMERLKEAVPCRIGRKWGLKRGERMVMPPIFRNLQNPVGYFCAFEKMPFHWGVMTLDGKTVVEPIYSEIKIGEDGIAELFRHGKVERRKLTLE